MEYRDLIEQITQTHPKLGAALVFVSIVFAEVVQYTTLPDILILGARLVSYALASWGSWEIIRYYRAKRKNLNNGQDGANNR